MRNLTEIFRKAISRNVDWTFSTFYRVIEILEKNGVGLSFWEGEENWATIHLNSKTVGYVWKKYPIVILEKTPAFLIKEQLKDIDTINYIEVELLTKDLFKIDEEELKAYFEDFKSFNSFTMEDL